MFSKKRVIKSIGFSVLFGVISGFVYSAGKVLDRTDAIQLADAGLALRILLGSLVSSAVCFGIWTGWDYLAEHFKRDGKTVRIPFPVLTAVQFILWIPYWLSIYPGVFSYDAYDEWQMVVQGVYTSHHPLIHTLYLGGLVEGLHSLTGNYNLGIALYTVSQMLLLSACFAYAAYRLNQRCRSLLMQVITVLYFSLHPVIAIFSVASVKDTLFCAAELVFFLLLYELYRDPVEFFSDSGRIVLLAVFTVLSMILRNNGLYIALACIVIALVYTIPDFGKIYKKWIVLGLLIAIPYLLYAGPLHRMLHVTGNEPQEKMSVMLQQVARVYTYNKNELPADELESLYRYVDEKTLDGYRATVSDFIKTDFNVSEYRKDPAGFYRLWAKWGTRYPMTYLSSFLINTVDGWYPGAVIDGYRTGEKSSYLDYRVAPPGEERILIPKLHDSLYKISFDKDAQKGILFTLIYSPGWYVLVFLCFWLYGISRKNRAFGMAGLVHVIHYATVLLGPMALVRYELNFFYAVPVCIWCLLDETSDGLREKKQ